MLLAAAEGSLAAGSDCERLVDAGGFGAVGGAGGGFLGFGGGVEGCCFSFGVAGGMVGWWVCECLMMVVVVSLGDAGFVW